METERIINFPVILSGTFTITQRGGDPLSESSRLIKLLENKKRFGKGDRKRRKTCFKKSLK